MKIYKKVPKCTIQLSKIIQSSLIPFQRDGISNNKELESVVLKKVIKALKGEKEDGKVEILLGGSRKLMMESLEGRDGLLEMFRKRGFEKIKVSADGVVLRRGTSVVDIVLLGDVVLDGVSEKSFVVIHFDSESPSDAIQLLDSMEEKAGDKFVELLSPSKSEKRPMKSALSKGKKKKGKVRKRVKICLPDNDIPLSPEKENSLLLNSDDLILELISSIEGIIENQTDEFCETYYELKNQYRNLLEQEKILCHDLQEKCKQELTIFEEEERKKRDQDIAMLTNEFNERIAKDTNVGEDKFLEFQSSVEEINRKFQEKIRDGEKEIQTQAEVLIKEELVKKKEKIQDLYHEFKKLSKQTQSEISPNEVEYEHDSSPSTKDSPLSVSNSLNDSLMEIGQELLSQSPQSPIKSKANKNLEGDDYITILLEEIHEKDRMLQKQSLDIVELREGVKDQRCSLNNFSLAYQEMKKKYDFVFKFIDENFSRDKVENYKLKCNLKNSAEKEVNHMKLIELTKMEREKQMQAEIDKLFKETRKLQKENDFLRHDRSRIFSNVSAMQVQSSELSRHNKEQHNTVQKDRSLITRLKKKNEDLKQEISNLNAIVSENKQLHSEIKEFQMQNENLKERVKKIKSKSSQKSDKQRALDKQRHNLVAQFSESRKKLKEKLRKAHDKEKKSLEKQFHTRFNNMKTTLESKIDELKQLVDVQKYKIEELKTHDGNQNAAVLGPEQQAELETKLNLLHFKHQKTIEKKDEEIASLIADVSALKKKNTKEFAQANQRLKYVRESMTKRFEDTIKKERMELINEYELKLEGARHVYKNEVMRMKHSLRNLIIESQKLKAELAFKNSQSENKIVELKQNIEVEYQQMNGDPMENGTSINVTLKDLDNEDVGKSPEQRKDELKLEQSNAELDYQQMNGHPLENGTSINVTLKDLDNDVVETPTELKDLENDIVESQDA